MNIYELNDIVEAFISVLIGILSVPTVLVLFDQLAKAKKDCHNQTQQIKKDDSAEAAIAALKDDVAEDCWQNGTCIGFCY